MNEKYPLALPAGTVLAGQYIIEKVLGQGGFGITYEAKDHKTSKKVAVKEFFPDAMATRTNQTTVLPFSGERGESYEYGKTCFLQEAETLAKFIGNENIVRIHSYFEENGTAYFVMDFIEGISFDEYIKQHGGKVSYEEVVKILVPVMDALSAVHSKGIVHRDVTPDNIYITKDGIVKLLDFGAARYSLGDKSRSLDIVLKHGFAPKEQYTRRGRQGSYTDVYSLGATFYFALTGKRPPDSVERMDEDELVLPSVLGVQIKREAEEAILKALSVQPTERFQSMTEFKNAMLNIQQTETTPPVPQNGPVVQKHFSAPTADQAVQQSFNAQAGNQAVQQNLGAPAVARPAQQNFNAGSQPGSVQRAGGNNAAPMPTNQKKKSRIVGVAVIAAAVVFVGFVMILAGGRKAEPTLSANSDGKNQEYESTQESTATQEPTGTPKPTDAPEPTDTPETTAIPESAADSPGDVSLVGNSDGNIMNGGIVVAKNKSRFYICDSQHSIYMINGEENSGYIFEQQNGIFSDLSLTGGELYFLYNGNAYCYHLDSGEHEQISSLKNHYSENIQHLFLTADYYVVCSENSDGTATVSRVSRSNGEKKDCCVIENSNEFTLSDDGWIYYVDKNDKNCALICRMRLDTLEKGTNLIEYDDAAIIPSNLIAVDDYLFCCDYYSDFNQYIIVRYDKDFDSPNFEYVKWNISTVIRIDTSPQRFGFNVSQMNYDIYFYVGAENENGGVPDLYHVKLYEDGTLNSDLLFEDSWSPCFIYYESGNYELCFYSVDNIANGPDYDTYYQEYDANGNKVNTN